MPAHGLTVMERVVEGREASMSTYDNAVKVRAFVEAIHDRDWDRLSPLMIEDVEIVDEATGKTMHGTSGLNRFITEWHTAFPDYRQDITGLIADDAGVAIEFAFSGTHSGSLQTSAGEIPATGRSIAARGAGFFRLENGRVASYRFHLHAVRALLQPNATTDSALKIRGTGFEMDEVPPDG